MLRSLLNLSPFSIYMFFRYDLASMFRHYRVPLVVRRRIYQAKANDEEERLGPWTWLESFRWYNVQCWEVSEPNAYRVEYAGKHYYGEN